MESWEPQVTKHDDDFTQATGWLLSVRAELEEINSFPDEPSVSLWNK